MDRTFVQNVLLFIIGTIELKEMVDIIETLYEMEGVVTSPAAERAQKLFEQLDINDDGHLDENEFVLGCLEDKNLVHLLNAGGRPDN